MAPVSTVEALPFASVKAGQKFVGALKSILGEGAEGASLPPLHALHAAVVFVPNVSMHLVTPPAHKDVLLSMTGIKMEPLSTKTPMWSAVAAAAAVARETGEDSATATRHLLLMGHQSLDPGLMSLDSMSIISDLTSDSGFASNSQSHSLMQVSKSSSDHESTLFEPAIASGWALGSDTGRMEIPASTAPPATAASATAAAALDQVTVVGTTSTRIRLARGRGRGLARPLALALALAWPRPRALALA